jgi:hypothetical protein
LELLWCLRAGFGGGGGWDFLGGGYLGMGIGGRGVAEEEEEEVGLLLGGGKEEKRLALPEREEDNATITIG